MRILLVDNNPVFSEIASDFLHSEIAGLTFLAVRSGEEALARAAEFQPDLILLDLNRSGLSGLQSIQRLQGSLPETRIIALAAINDESYRRAALATGAHAFVAKANVGAELLPVIRRFSGLANGG